MRSVGAPRVLCRDQSSAQWGLKTGLGWGINLRSLLLRPFGGKSQPDGPSRKRKNKEPRHRAASIGGTSEEGQGGNRVPQPPSDRGRFWRPRPDYQRPKCPLGHAAQGSRISACTLEPKGTRTRTRCCKNTRESAWRGLVVGPRKTRRAPHPIHRQVVANGRTTCSTTRQSAGGEVVLEAMCCPTWAI